MTTTENVRLYKNRAAAATRLLERRRESLEVAITALEIVGYKVYQDREGRYRVEPPNDRIGKYETFREMSPTPEMKAGMLEEYPTMLSVKDVSEIMGLSEGAVRRLCKQEKIPNMKIGGRIRIPKQCILESLGVGKAGER